MPETTATTIATELLRQAGVPEEQIPALLERAAQLIEGLASLADLDLRLPEPALVWQPATDVSA